MTWQPHMHPPPSVRIRGAFNPGSDIAVDLSGPPEPPHQTVHGLRNAGIETRNLFA